MLFDAASEFFDVGRRLGPEGERWARDAIRLADSNPSRALGCAMVAFERNKTAWAAWFSVFEDYIVRRYGVTKASIPVRGVLAGGRARTFEKDRDAIEFAVKQSAARPVTVVYEDGEVHICRNGEMTKQMGMPVIPGLTP